MMFSDSFNEHTWEKWEEEEIAKVTYLELSSIRLLLLSILVCSFCNMNNDMPILYDYR